MYLNITSILRLEMVSDAHLRDALGRAQVTAMMRFHIDSSFCDEGRQVWLLGTTAYDLMRVCLRPPAGLTLEVNPSISIFCRDDRPCACYDIPLNALVTRANRLRLYEAGQLEAAPLVIRATFTPERRYIN